MSAEGPWIGAADAARLLGVSRATLYAYVSRGYVRSQSMPGSSRERQYARDDVERLRRRTEERRDPDKAAAHALQWGMPILESSIALIDGQTLYYRGHNAVTLARTRSVEQVASLIWTGSFDTSFAAGAPPASVMRDAAPLPRASAVISAVAAAAASRSASRADRRAADSMADLSFVARAQSSLATASARDPLAFDLRPEGVALTGWRILHLLTQTTVSATKSATKQRPASSRSIDESLAEVWGVPARGVDLIRAALILCADHELNVSSFTARCVASAGSNPYAVVIAGLAALEGTRHGGISARVESMLASLRDSDGRGSRGKARGRVHGAGQARSARHAASAGQDVRMTGRVASASQDVRTAIADRLRRGERVDGFGHPLYRDRDPRAAAILDLLRERYASSVELAFVFAVADAATTAMREPPTVDFALAALARVLRLPPGAALTLFAIGRTIGWIGHAIEQYATGQLIRPRAKYVGPVPG